MATPPADDIIEKRDTSMLAVSCLVIACVALLGAIAFQLMELGEYKRGGAIAKATKRADDDVKNFRAKVSEYLNRTAEAAAAAGTDEAAAGGEGADEKAATEPGDAEPKEGTEEQEGDASKADENAGGDDAAAEPTEDEK